MSRVKKIQLQKATIQDIPTLISIEQKLVSLKTYSAMTDTKEWQQEIEKPNTTVYLVKKDGRIIGNASYERKEDGTACITGLVIEPEFQGQGIGRQALEKILEELKDAKTIELVTHPENPALEMYTLFGFIVKERKENYFGDGEPRLVLVKQSLGNRVPGIVQDVGFDFHWDSEKVWKLDIPVTEMGIEELIWHFEIPFWEKDDTDDYNLTPKEVMEYKEGTKAHRDKIEEADLQYPIDVMENKGRWLILDGLHRLVKAYERGQKKVDVRIIPREKIPDILKEK